VRASGRKLAELTFVSGEVVRAKHGHLAGEDAVYQLFQSPVEGEFSFTGCAVEEAPSPREVTLPAISLLMESVRLQDELSVLRERLPDPRRVFRQKVPHLAWDAPETLELAAAVWSRLKRGGTLEELQREVPRCSHAIYATVAALLDGGQVE